MQPLHAGEADNVLLVAPRFARGVEEVCGQLLDVDAPGEGLVGVSVTTSPRQWSAEYADRLSGLPPRTWLVCTGERTRSAADSGVTLPAGEADVTVKTVPHPGNLTKLGVALTECLPEAAPAGLCFDSVGTLYQHADSRTVFQFLQVLADHVAANDVGAHYHVDPAAVDERDLNRLELVFDAVVEVSEGGERTVRTR